uniref:C2H2-type domain-containing protein n=1 Tax=Amphilophus citrinellus TaxID=61819 RepID=A0A3Q0T278_AMPCI
RYGDCLFGRGNTDQEGSPAGSPSRTNIDVSGEFSCLLINEEGYLQEPNVLYPEQVSGDSGSRFSFRGQGIRIGHALDSTEDMYEPSDAYSDTLNLGEQLQYQAAVRGVRRHSCNQCSMSFPDSVSLKAHKQTHKGTGQGPPYSCNQCGKTFTQACNLKVHQRIHLGQGLHLCSHCGKGFPSFSDLKAHKCGQMGDKPYCCTVCGNKFSRLWNLKLHQRIHTQEKPHRYSWVSNGSQHHPANSHHISPASHPDSQSHAATRHLLRCGQCGKCFPHPSNLKAHLQTHTGERPFCCSLCGRSFTKLSNLKAHRRVHTGERPLEPGIFHIREMC